MMQTMEEEQIVAGRVLVRVEKNEYGSIPGLDDEELADPLELERQVLVSEWWPVLALPCPEPRSDIRPAVDEAGGVDWGAFGTVDFERYRSSSGRGQTNVRELREMWRDKLVMLSIVQARLPRQAREVLKHFQLGTIELEHIQDMDVVTAARLHSEAQKLRRKMLDVQRGDRRREREIDVEG